MSSGKELSRLRSGAPEWLTIQQTAVTPVDTPPVKRLSMLSLFRKVRPATAETIRARLNEHDPAHHEVIEQMIHNTVGFARNTLEAQRNAHSRAVALNYDRSDWTETGPHMAYRLKAQSQEEAQRTAGHRMRELTAAARELPFERHGVIALAPHERPLFFGAAELYGMARADFHPSDLMEYLRTTDVVATNHRTEYLLRNARSVVGALIAEAGPAQALAQVRVNLPEAMTMADTPTRGVVLGAAFRIIDGYEPTPHIVG